MNNTKAVKQNASTGNPPQKTTFLGMDVSLFAGAALTILAVMTLAYPFALYYLVYPFIYSLARDGFTPSCLPVMASVGVWFFPLFWFEYWFLGKRRRMQEAQAELERQREKPQPPQP
ncbi:hypothetical protein [Oscillibacter sp.]|uniref:hypothetical protein n=1 Tax=Oscillibacter sp. TaxID=1945593 RepID=UPI00289CE548|nr:hypothetical protein [Oscillibacter sp.]